MWLFGKCRSNRIKKDFPILVGKVLLNGGFDVFFVVNIIFCWLVSEDLHVSFLLYQDCCKSSS